MLYLQVTEVNHTDNAFYMLGGAGFKTQRERSANLATIPLFEHDCENADVCYVLDVLDADGNLDDDREISRETAAALIGTNDFGPIREAYKRDLEAMLYA